MNNCPAILLCQLAIRLLRLVKIVVPLLFAESVFSIPISTPKPVFGLEGAARPGSAVAVFLSTEISLGQSCLN